MKKRLAFIDHSFHQKTTATFFLMDMLREHCEVEIFWDESWLNGPRVDIGKLGQMGFDTIILFQLIDKYTPVELKNCGCRNIVLIPMYDHSGGWPDSFWLQYRDYKILNFSRSLHRKLETLGLKTKYFQYFLPPDLPMPEHRGPEALHGFFWQRTDQISWDQIHTLISGTDFESFHLHLAVDPPGYRKVVPSAEDMKKYDIVISEWSDSREEYLKILSASNVFFAPRLYEGIGMSFIEAMAQGKFIVAPDYPTMNEYVVDGVNGLLYDPNNISPLTFPSAIDFEVSVRTRAGDGYEKWISQKAELTDFILDRGWFPSLVKSVVANLGSLLKQGNHDN